MAQPPPQYTYAPPPNEAPYYAALFAAADKQHAGALSGPAAVEFLSLSKLPVELLKQIWTMADQPQTNTLDATKFYVAVRLIQLFQNGKKPVDLALHLAEGDAGMRPPFFEGVDVRAIMAQQQQQGGGAPQPPPPQQPQGAPQPSPPMQPQPQPSPQQSPLPPAAQPAATMNGAMPPQPPQGGAPAPQFGESTAMTVQDPYTMTPTELTRYEALFPTYAVPDDPNNPESPKFVLGAAAVELFSKSGMDRESLKAVWTMCDDPVDNKLDSLEFSVAMHLIVCVTKKGLPMPQGTLPASLKGLVAEVRAQRQPQPQGGMQGAVLPPQVGGLQVPPSPGGIPSPDKAPGMGMMPQQPQMNGGMPPPQMGQQQMQGTMPPPQQMGMGQVQPGMQQMGLQPTGSFSGGGVGGHTVDDAFAGMDNAPVEDVDEYSTIGGQDASVAGGMSTIGGFGGQAAVGTMGGIQPAVQEVATPEPSPQPVAPAVQATAAIPPPPMQHALPPKSPRVVPRSPRIASPRAGAKSIPASEESTAELASLREAHQKLQAEVISLRAKAASVGDEEMANQKEIAQLAGEIGKLSIELSELKDAVAEGKAKLAESVGTLKIQMEKKESLEAQIAEARSTHEALMEAHEAVSEANDLAVSQQARAVAAAAAAKEEAESVIPPPQPQPQPVETADLFSWDAPAPAAEAPAPMPAMGAQPEPESNVPTWAADAPSVQEPAPAPWGASDNASLTNTAQANQVAPAPAAAMPAMGTTQMAAPPTQEEQDHFSVYSAGTSNQNPYGGFGGMGAMGAPMGGGDMFGGAMGGPPAPQQPFMAPMGGAPAPQQPAMTPMGGAPAPSAFDSHPVAAATPPRASFASAGSVPAPAPQQYQQQQQPAPPSPSKAELEAAKAETAKAERSFRETADLVRSISTEVNKLESAAKKAENDMKEMEGKTKKGSFVGGKKKKAKKEYEKAMEVAQAERKKVQEAKEHLKAAEREADKAKRAVEERRQKFEQMEIEAATAASYLSVQQSASDSQSVAGQSMANQYADPFGTMGHAPAPAAMSHDQYGMGGAPAGGSGGYDNPFL